MTLPAKMTTKALYYLPVNPRFADWEYYKVDSEALHDLFDEVVVCNSIWQVMASCRGVAAIYCWWWHASMPVVLLARLLGIPTVVTGAIHMFDISGASDFYSKSPLFRLFASLSLRLADANLFISQDQFRQMTSHLSVNNALIVRSSLGKTQPMAPDTILKTRADLRAGRGGNEKVVFVSIVWQTQVQFTRKGVWETLGAFALLKKRTKLPFEWIVAGKADDGTESLRAKVLELGLSNEVKILTDVTSAKKSDLYLSADLYIQSSWHEGFGNAVLEAMSHGAPALVSRYTAQPEGVGNCGLIAMDISPEALADKLEYFMSLDEPARTALSKAALTRALTEFSYAKRVSEMSSAFADLGIVGLKKS